MRLLAVLAPLGLLACTGTPEPEPEPEPAPAKTESAKAPESAEAAETPADAELSEAAKERAARKAYWVQRTDAELAAAFTQACQASTTDGKPVLVAFTAEWCPDCKRMYALSKQPPLKDELGNWHTVVVDPGRFDRHTDTLQGFGVDRIVTWVATRPTDCTQPAATWPRLKQAVFEPQTGQPWTQEQIAEWLVEARG